MIIEDFQEQEIWTSSFKISDIQKAYICSKKPKQVVVYINGVAASFNQRTEQGARDVLKEIDSKMESYEMAKLQNPKHHA